MLGRRLRGLRLRAGLSQEDLAGLPGIGVRTIGNIEADRASPRLPTPRVSADPLDSAGRAESLAAAVTDGPGRRDPPAVPVVVEVRLGRYPARRRHHYEQALILCTRPQIPGAEEVRAHLRALDARRDAGYEGRP